MNRSIYYAIDRKKYRVREYANKMERTIGWFSELRDARICKAGHHWINGDIPLPKNNFGFVYEVKDNLTGMKYIGKKQYYFFNGGTDSSNDVRDPNWNPDSWNESDWKFYTTSSLVLAPIIAERPKDFEFSIISQYPSKLTLHLGEIEEQKKADVLNALMDNGERLYYNQNIASCEFNIHTTGEVARSIRYNPLYQAWTKLMSTGDLMPEEWKDPKEFIRIFKKKAKGMERPAIVKLDDSPYSEFNTRVTNVIGVQSSSKFKGVAKLGNYWIGNIKLNTGEILEVKGVSDRHAAAELDTLIDKHELELEKQVLWVRKTY